jgi:dihydropteroate synthase
MSAVLEHTIPLSRGGTLDLRAPGVMGVLNVTPDSFSDGGRHLALSDALACARRLQAEGACVIDVGGESTRPGAAAVPAAEEIARVVPVIEALTAEGFSAPISIDTRKAPVAAAALEAGAQLVNDVSGLADPDLARVCADHGAALIVGHIQGVPLDMQADPRYEAVVDEVYTFLASACQRAEAAGVPAGHLLVDPGIGFGKLLQHNLALLAHLGRFGDLGPVVVGLSRKSMLGALLGDGGAAPLDERLAGGLGGAVWSALAGARLIRTHDVRPTCDALRVAWAIRGAAC